MASRREVLFLTTQTGADGDALQARLASQSRPIPTTEQDLQDIEVFTHTWDPSRATAWFERARNPLVSGLPASAHPAFAATPVVRGLASGMPIAKPQGGQPTFSERVAQVIDTLSPAEQTSVASESIASFLKGLRALGVNPRAFKAYRALVSRAWGFYAPEDDHYLEGVSSEALKGRYQASLYPSVWRRSLGAGYASSYGGSFGSDVIFGLLEDYNDTTIGCRSTAEDSDLRTAASCYAPTAEVHSVWVQGNATNRGGKLYSHAQVAAGIGDGVRVPGGSPWWRTPVYEPHDPMIGRKRLHAIPPLSWYWELFFLPMVEFGGYSFCDWLLSQASVRDASQVPYRELLRGVRRQNTQRNAAMASAYGGQIADLVGEGERNAAVAQQRAERSRQALENGVTSIASVAREVDPTAGLISGSLALVGNAVARIAAAPSATVHVDVFGDLYPVFIPFNIYMTRTAFDEAMERVVGMPSGASEGANVSLSALDRPRAPWLQVAVVPLQMGLAAPAQPAPSPTPQGPSPAQPPSSGGELVYRPPPPKRSWLPWVLGTMVVSGVGAAGWYWRADLSRLLAGARKRP